MQDRPTGARTQAGETKTQFCVLRNALTYTHCCYQSHEVPPAYRRTRTLVVQHTHDTHQPPSAHTHQVYHHTSHHASHLISVKPGPDKQGTQSTACTSGRHLHSGSYGTSGHPLSEWRSARRAPFIAAWARRTARRPGTWAKMRLGGL